MLRASLPQDVKMTMHRASGRWKLGLALAMVTALCWATLPLALKITLEVVDPITLTWFRFLTAAGIVFAWLAARGHHAWRRARPPQGQLVIANPL